MTRILAARSAFCSTARILKEAAPQKVTPFAMGETQSAAVSTDIIPVTAEVSSGQIAELFDRTFILVGLSTHAHKNNFAEAALRIRMRNIVEIFHLGGTVSPRS